jgi:hypothetical protein
MKTVRLAFVITVAIVIFSIALAHCGKALGFPE